MGSSLVCGSNARDIVIKTSDVNNNDCVTSNNKDAAPVVISANLRRAAERKRQEAQRQASASDDDRQLNGDTNPWTNDTSGPSDNTQTTYLRRHQGKNASQNPVVKKVAEDKSSAGPPRSTGEPEDPATMKPFKDPSHALTEAMGYLANEEWDVKCTGLNFIRRLAAHHPGILQEQLHSTIVALIKEVKNLRSQVCRLAIISMGDMFGWLKKAMDSEVDQCTRVLLDKTGETNNFIRNAALQALTVMTDNVTPQRAMVALSTLGTSHKNAGVRRTASHLLVAVVEKLGPGRVLSGVKDMTDRILPVTAHLLLDGQAETRYNAQKIFHMLMNHDDFDAMMSKCVDPNTLRNIQDKLDTLRKKGLGNPPSESANSRRSGQQRSKSDYRENDNGDDNISDNRSYSSTSSKKSRPVDMPSAEVKVITALMASNDWRDRQRGISQLQELIDTSPDVVGSNIVKVFDCFNPCLKDSNTKVNLQALQVMSTNVLPLARYISQSQVIGHTIHTVVPNLSSGNRDIYDEAVAVLDAFTEHLDHCILVQPFVSQAQNGNIRIKPDMVHRVACLVPDVYERKPKHVTMHVLPLLWHLLATSSKSGAAGSADLRQATSKLTITLHVAMGDSLMEAAQTSPGMTSQLLQQLQDMLDREASR